MNQDHGATTAAMVLKLRTSDGVDFDMEASMVSMSQTLRTMMTYKMPASGVVPMQGINSSVFAKIVEYCKRHTTVVDESAGKVVIDA